jgi:hypothetical protein
LIGFVVKHLDLKYFSKKEKIEEIDADERKLS